MVCYYFEKCKKRNHETAKKNALILTKILPFCHILELLRWDRHPIHRSVPVDLLKGLPVGLQAFQYLLQN